VIRDNVIQGYSVNKDLDTDVLSIYLDSGITIVIRSDGKFGLSMSLLDFKQALVELEHLLP